MDSIYMNNYRGFSQAVVPLRPVNFFVGENSTGKSSLLALVELLSTPEFWFNLDFNVGNYKFGGYKDIASAFADDKKEFQIGLCKNNNENPDRNVCYLLNFCEAKDGVPQLFQVSHLCQHFLATLKFSGREIAARMVTDLPPSADCSSPENCFKFLRETTIQPHSDYKVYTGEDKRFARQAPLAALPMILRELFEDKKVKEKIRFRSPFPAISMSFAGMAPIRTTPKRTYDGYTKRFSPEGEHTPYVIRKELSRRGNKTAAFRKALEAFGNDSGLFQSVGVTQFGKDSSSPFELTVKLSEKALRVNSVGYGVSQVLPVVVELLTHEKGSLLAIQQPEVHLHPKAQAALGDVLFHAAIDESQTLFVETHSDYLLDRFRLSMREHKHPDGFAQVIFFERSTDGNHVFPMVIDSSGEYPEDQPPGFRSFFLSEQRRILGI